MNNIIKDTNVKEAGRTYIIRMSDFYLENVGGQEFCEISREVYAELLRFKAIDEGVDPSTVDPDTTPTVIIKVGDFYPRSKDRAQYREISRDEYNNLVERKSALDKERGKTNIPSDSDKVTVRTKDFYPYLCSSKEYSELERSTYVRLLRFMITTDHTKRADDPFCKPTALVKIRIRDFFPDYGTGEEYNEIPVEIFMELLRFIGATGDKADKIKRKNTIRIKVSDFYPDNCCEAEHCEVSVAVYEQLIKDRYEDEAIRIDNLRHFEGYEFNELEIGERNGIYTDSSEKTIYYAILLRDLFKPYGEMMYRRAYMYFIEGCSVKGIAAAENISERAVRKYLNKIKPIVKNAGTEYFGID